MMKILVAKQQVKTVYDKYQPVITIGTVKEMVTGNMYSDDFNWDDFTKKELSFGRDARDQYAWGLLHGSMICSNYKGKDRDMEIKRQSYEDAVLIEDGESVIIDGNVFVATVLAGDYSDKIHFKLVGEVNTLLMEN